MTHLTTLAMLARGLAPLFHDIGRRLATLEVKERGIDGVDGTDGAIGPAGPEGKPGRDGLAAPPGATGAAGRDGTNGTDGVPGRAGKDGLDGLGFDDLTVVHDGEQGFTFRFTRGDQVKAFPFVLPVEMYKGVYVEGTAYVRGHCVTWAGSVWHCNEATSTKPGDGSPAWTLMVKRGGEGKPGKPGDRGPAGTNGKDGTSAKW